MPFPHSNHERQLCLSYRNHMTRYDTVNYKSAFPFTDLLMRTCVKIFNNRIIIHVLHRKFYKLVFPLNLNVAFNPKWLPRFNSTDKTNRNSRAI